MWQRRLAAVGTKTEAGRLCHLPRLYAHRVVGRHCHYRSISSTIVASFDQSERAIATDGLPE